VLELSASSPDPGKIRIAAGIREVKEKTGYTVRPEDIIGQSPLVSLAPWLTSSSTNVVPISVDLSLPENVGIRRPVQYALQCAGEVSG
jgi:8-oxo-dGTP pyrophosphatase MutT (NUDIX family)